MKGGLAIIAGSAPYRGELDYVSSTIRMRRSFTSTADTSSLPWISASRRCSANAR